MAHTASLAGSIEAFDAVCRRSRRRPRRHARRRRRGHASSWSIPARRAGRRLGAITLSGAFRGLLLRRRRAQRPAISKTRRCDARKAQCHSRRRLAGLESDRWRFWRAEQRRQLQSLDRGAAGRSEYRHDPDPGEPAARAGLRPRRALHSHRGGDRGWRRAEAGCHHHAGVAQPERLQPRAAGKSAARLVPAGSQQVAACHRECGPAR